MKSPSEPYAMLAFAPVPQTQYSELKPDQQIIQHLQSWPPPVSALHSGVAAAAGWIMSFSLLLCCATNHHCGGIPPYIRQPPSPAQPPIGLTSLPVPSLPSLTGGTFQTRHFPHTLSPPIGGAVRDTSASQLGLHISGLLIKTKQEMQLVSVQN